jgi:hypothetical protein
VIHFLGVEKPDRVGQGQGGLPVGVRPQLARLDVAQNQRRESKRNRGKFVKKILGEFEKKIM